MDDVTEAGENISKAKGVQSVKFEKGVVIVNTGSGQYKFVSKLK